MAHAQNGLHFLRYKRLTLLFFQLVQSLLQSLRPPRSSARRPESGAASSRPFKTKQVVLGA